MAACIVKRVRSLPLRPWRTHAHQAQVHEALVDLLHEFIDERHKRRLAEAKNARLERGG